MATEVSVDQAEDASQHGRRVSASSAKGRVEEEE